MNRIRPVLYVFALVLLVALAGCGGGQPEPETGYTTSDDLQTLLDRITRTVSGVRSSATAEEALPVLEGISQDLDRLLERLPALSGQVRTDMSVQAQRALPGLRDNARRINNTDGVDLIGPILNTMVGQVSQFLM
jgi:hypothetical protein